MGVSHKKLSRWYHLCGQNLEAGVPLSEAMRSAKGPPQSDVNKMTAQLQAGASVDRMLQDAPRWMPEADRYLLSAAAESGRMPDALYKLGAKHMRAAENMSKVIFATLYPLGLLHFGIFLFPVFSLVEFDENSSATFHPEAYVGDVLSFLIPVWVFITVLIVLVKMRSPIIRIIIRMLPGLRGYSRNQAIADFAFALESFLKAGAPMLDSWFAAGKVSADPDIEKAALAMSEKIKKGEAPGKYLSMFSVFPSEFTSLYTTGEQTGQLDKNLLLLTRQYQETANKKLAVASFWYPKLIFVILAFYVGYQILGFYSQYLGGILDMIE